jgi:pimeloyl-ACP methyl ester carboxylesterase
MGHLGDGYRVVTTSLLGYGATPDIRPDGNATMAQQVCLIDRIIDQIGTSPHVVRHSYGGLSAIVHALTGRHRSASLLLVEANPLGLLRASGDLEHYGMFESMTGAYFADFARGRAGAAVGHHGECLDVLRVSAGGARSGRVRPRLIRCLRRCAATSLRPRR